MSAIYNLRIHECMEVDGLTCRREAFLYQDWIRHLSSGKIPFWTAYWSTDPNEPPDAQIDAGSLMELFDAIKDALMNQTGLKGNTE